VDMGWLRADTTVVPADIKYPTDSGLLTKGITRIAVLVGRLQAAGIAPRTLFVDQTPAARQGAHRIGSKLRRRSDDAKAEVLAITVNSPIWPKPPLSRPDGSWSTRSAWVSGRCTGSAGCSQTSVMSSTPSAR
jgi:hypothetical protein